MLDIKWFKDSEITEENKRFLVKQAVNILLEYGDKNNYIIFPQTINGITYYTREELEEELNGLEYINLAGYDY
jgi:hypothetical protein